MKVLVTGASGFIGARTLKTLYSMALDFKVAGRSHLPGVPTEIVGQIDSKTDWGRTLEGVDTVIHLAAFAHGKPKSEKEFYEINFEGTKNLAEQARKAGVSKFIYLGSIGSVKRVSHVPLKETDKPEPDTPYTKSKFYGEEAVRDSFKGRHTILRAPAVFGKGCKGNLRTLLKLRDLPIPIHEGAVRALIDVDSLANYLAQSVTKDPLGTVHVANPESLALSEIAQIMGLRFINSPRALFTTIGYLEGLLKPFGVSKASLVPLFEPLRVSTEVQQRVFKYDPPSLKLALKNWLKEETL
jgi:nucleoside-diphosphate-sugar epimerase